MKNILPLSEDDFGLFQELLVEESGLYFEKDRSQSLHFALWERLQNRGYDSYKEYYNLLKFHLEGRIEIRELLDLITIGETYFFRNRPQFEALMRIVLPGIVQRKMYSRDKSIRVWSAGCSKGDEAYSIAIAITEVLPSYENWDISILGTDINRNVLACAKEALYGEKDIGHLPKEYLDKYFKKRGPNYVLKPSVRKLAGFEYHNLAKDPFIHEGMQNLDIIFCRNVIIYFDFHTTKRVIDNFYNCLIRDGSLFLGHAETLWQLTNKFETVEFPQTFVYKKALIPIEEEVMKPFIGVPEIEREGFVPIEEAVLEEGGFPKEAEPELEEKAEPIGEIEKPPAEEKEIESLYTEATILLEEKKYEEALWLSDKIIAQDKNHIGAYFTKATILANQAKYEDAADILAKIIEADNLNVEAYYLLGVLSYKTSDFKDAETQFKKVIYADPDIVLAYFNLGNIYLYQRRFSKAAREFSNAIRLLEKRPKDEQVRFCEDFTAEFLLRACKNTLGVMIEKDQLHE
jgi:chemotaxis protein methyltransferase CheR